MADNNSDDPPLEERRKKKINPKKRNEVTRFVRRSHKEDLAEDIDLLSRPGWLEILWDKYCSPKKATDEEK